MSDVTTVPRRQPTASFTVRFDLYPGGDLTTSPDTITPDRDQRPPRIAWDLDARNPRTLSDLHLVGSDVDHVNMLTDQIIPVLVGPDGTESVMGLFAFSAGPRTTTTADTSRLCRLADLSLILDQGLTATIGWPQGTPLSTAMADIVALNAWPRGWVISVTDITLAEAKSYRAGSSKQAALGDLAELAGFLPPLFDRNGTGFLTPPPPLDQAIAASHDYPLDATSIVTADGYVDDDDTLDQPNTWVATSTSAGAGEVSGHYTLPASAPNSVANRNGLVIVEQVDAPGAGSSDQAAVMARQAAENAPGATRTVELETAINPDHDIAGTVEFGGDRWLETAWSFVMVPGAQMAHAWRRPAVDA